MKLLSRNLLISAVAITIASLIPTSAQAATTCKVATRDRTNLTVHNTPNGESTNALRFGREVQIQDSSRDREGSTWVKVSSNYNGEYRNWGWVRKNYLDCGGQSQVSKGKKVVTVYGRMSCPATANMIRQLAQNGVPYLFKDTDIMSNSQEMDRRFQLAGLTKKRGVVPLCKG